MPNLMNVADYYLNIGGNQLTISPFAITPRKSLDLNEKITTLKIKFSPFGKLPPEDGESKEDYEKRFKEHFAKQDEGKDDETAEQFLERMYKSTQHSDNLDYLYECLLAVAEVFGKSGMVNKEAFMDLPMVSVNNFVVNVMTKAKVPCGLVLEDLPTTEF